MRNERWYNRSVSPYPEGATCIEKNHIYYSNRFDRVNTYPHQGSIDPCSIADALGISQRDAQHQLAAIL